MFGRGFTYERAASHAVTGEHDCVRALRHAAARLGESPTKAQYEALGLTPASGTIQRVMGGWNAAKEAAGLPVVPGAPRTTRRVSTSTT